MTGRTVRYEHQEFDLNGRWESRSGDMHITFPLITADQKRACETERMVRLKPLLSILIKKPFVEVDSLEVAVMGVEHSPIPPAEEFTSVGDGVGIFTGTYHQGPLDGRAVLENAASGLVEVYSDLMIARVTYG